jgi:hypothetical protein
MMSDLRANFRLTALLCAVSYVTSASAADAPDAVNPGPTRTACLDAHRLSQELRKDSKLLESQEQLLICSSETCPGAIITDCGKWLSEMDQLTPSLAFEVRVDGKDTSLAQVELDGRALADWSKSVKVNPGRHDVRVVVEGFEPYSANLLTLEGQRLKLVSAEFKTKQVEAPKPRSLAPPPVFTRPTPAGTYVLLGLGVLGAGGFVTFASLGKTKQNQLDNDCTKLMTCSDTDLKPMKTMYLVGDISAGVGAAALLGAAVLYFTRPTVEASTTSFQVGTLGGSRSSFGVSASHPW